MLRKLGRLASALMQWGATPDRHGLFGEFRFRDPNMERKYSRWLNEWGVGPMRVHATLVLLLCGQTLVSYYGNAIADLPATFWSHSFPIVLSIMLLLFLQLQRNHAPLRRATLPAHSLFSACITSWMAFLVYQWPHEWQAFALHRTLAEVVTALSPAAQGQLQHFMMGMYVPASSGFGIMMNQIQLIFLCILPFSWWSVLAAWTMLPVFLTSMLLSQLHSGLYVADGTLRMCLFCGVCTFLGAQLSLMRRSNFLAEQLIAQQFRASEMADSVLNHGLKNTMADAASNVELFLNGELPATALQDSLISLRRGMRSCKERQLYLKLAAGEYEPVMLPTNLEDFGQQLIAGRQVVGHFCSRTVMLDSMLCSLIFDNAINNAFRHGHPRQPDVHFSIGEDCLPHDPLLPNPLSPDRVRLIMVVRNTANPSRPPLTDEFVAQVVSGQSSHSLPALQATADAGQPGLGTPMDPPSALSDRIGLSHCFMAAQRLGMRLSLTQDGGIVRLVAVYDALVVQDSPIVSPNSVRLAGLAPWQLHLFPAGLHYRCLDDSLAARHLLEFHITKHLSPGSVVCQGAEEGDVETFVELALEEADVVILDQHLEYTFSYLGTDILRRLRDNGFKGLLCVRSANNTPLDVALFHRSGAHCVFGKDLTGQAVAEQIKAAWVRLSRQGLVAPRQPPTAESNLVESVCGSGHCTPLVSAGLPLDDLDCTLVGPQP